jgi:hypothetical protein
MDASNIETDEPYIQNAQLPNWIIPISGWGDPDMKDAHRRMHIYLSVAKEIGVNIIFSSRLGTFTSYKRAPSVAAEIKDNNNKTFLEYQKSIHPNWYQNFVDKTQEMLGN